MFNKELATRCIRCGQVDERSLEALLLSTEQDRRQRRAPMHSDMVASASMKRDRVTMCLFVLFPVFVRAFAHASACEPVAASSCSRNL